MTKRPLFLAALLPAALLAGCGGTKNRGLESVHQPVVQRHDFAYDFAVSSRGLAPGEDRRLAGWLDTLRLGYGDSVALDDPAGNPAVHDDVARAVGYRGLLLAEQAQVAGAPVAAGTVRVVVSRATASVPGCPDMSRVRGPDFESNANSNYGCSVNANFASMVASPMDLVRGQTGSDLGDPAVAAKAIEAYRKQPTTGANGLPGGVTSVSVVKGK